MQLFTFGDIVISVLAIIGLLSLSILLKVIKAVNGLTAVSNMILKYLGFKGDVKDAVETGLDVGARFTMGKAGSAAAQIAYAEPLIQKGLAYAPLAIRSALSLLMGHFGGDKEQFIEFLAIEGRKYKVNMKRIPLTAGIDTASAKELESLTQMLDKAKRCVTEKLEELKALAKPEIKPEEKPENVDG